MYTKTTHHIKITVLPQYLKEQSEPADDKYFWAYTIQVENHSEETVQLVNRYWQITDANGVRHEVRGPGVVGETPTLKPGDAFQYTSGVPLNTPSGIMVGQYEMMSAKGERLDVAVPAFSLDSPSYKPVLN